MTVPSLLELNVWKMLPLAGGWAVTGAGSVAEKSSVCFFLPMPRNCACAGVAVKASPAAISVPAARLVRNFIVRPQMFWLTYLSISSVAEIIFEFTS